MRFEIGIKPGAQSFEMDIAGVGIERGDDGFDCWPQGFQELCDFNQHIACGFRDGISYHAQAFPDLDSAVSTITGSLRAWPNLAR